MRKSLAFHHLHAFEPKLYRRYQRAKKAILWFAFVILPVLCVVLSIGVAIWGSGEFVVPLFASLILVVGPFDIAVLLPAYGLVLVFGWICDRSIADRERIAMNERTTKHFSVEQEQNAKLLTEVQARAIGSHIIAGEGATVYNNSFNNSTVVDRSTLIHSMNRFQTDDQLADALKIVAGIVQNSKNAAAIETLNEFNKKIASKDSKITLRALWDQIVKLVPTVAEIGGAASKIVDWLSSPGAGSV
jgi:hypothetical protein